MRQRQRAGVDVAQRGGAWSAAHPAHLEEGQQRGAAADGGEAVVGRRAPALAELQAAHLQASSKRRPKE